MFSGLFDLPWWGYTLVALALTHATIASVTIFLHRHQAHRALDLAPAASHCFRFWLWLTTGMVTREWAAIHRKHHAKVESGEDPHSPQVLGLNRVLWGGVLLYAREARNAETLARFGYGTPDDWLERRVYTPLRNVGIVVMLAADLALFGILPGLFIWGVQMVWIPFWAAGVINGVGHFWGYRSFACADASKNIVPWGILIGGEELHNNHHAFASSAKLSYKWYEFDLGWLYIRTLQFVRLATVKKIAPKPRLGAVRAAVDAATLQALITYRYDVLAKYMRSLRRIAAEEIGKLRLDAPHRQALRRWLRADEKALPAAELERFAAVLQKSQRLSLLVTMRADLEALWARSTASHEQLVKQLQEWVHRAEQSGIAPLQEFSWRLRRYAI